MFLKKIITPVTILILLDWLRLLRRLIRHRQLLPVNRYLSLIPGIGNLYLRLYFTLERPVPGTNDPKIKDIKERDALVRPCQANVKRASIY